MAKRRHRLARRSAQAQTQHGETVRQGKEEHQASMVALLSREQATPRGMVATSEQIQGLLQEAKDLVEQTTFSSNTKKAYASDWRNFVAWCSLRHGLSDQDCFPTPPWLVVAWLMDARKTKRLSTLERMLVTLSHRHRGAGLLSPTEDRDVRYTWKAIRKEMGLRKQKRASALPLDILQRILFVQSQIAHPLLAIRNRALFAIGFFAGLRVSELADLRLEHLTWEREGLVILVPQSKADQMGEGREIAIPYAIGRIKSKEDDLLSPPLCAPSLLKAWLVSFGLDYPNARGSVWRKHRRAQGHRQRKNEEGQAVRSEKKMLFCEGEEESEKALSALSANRITKLFKESLVAIGETRESYSVHSLRAGVATLLAVQGSEEREIQEHLRHKDPKQTRKYIRVAQRWQRAALRVLYQSEEGEK